LISSNSLHPKNFFGRVRSGIDGRYDLLSHAARGIYDLQLDTFLGGWIMTRKLIAAASRNLLVLDSGASRRRRSRANPCVENLEHRLSLSSYSVGFAPAIIGNHIGAPAPADLNPQPLPPGIFHVQPMHVGEHVGA